MAKKRDGKVLKKIEEAHGKQHYALAGELSRRHVASYPEDLEGLWLNGLSLYFLDRNEEAKRQLETALPLFSDAFRGAALTYLARISRETNKIPEAQRYYWEAIKADPKDSDNYVELAGVFAAFNKPTNAEMIAKKGIEADATPVEAIHHFLGNFYRSKGELAKAYESFHHVTDELDQEDAEAAIEDIEEAAELLGVTLPEMDAEADDKSGSENEKDHVPGQMVANIHREFFVNILSGEKKIEYRAFTPYWRTRIDNAGPPPFHLRVINGMLKNAPELTVVVEKVLINEWVGEYEIHLGKIMDVKNWDRDSQASEE